MPDIFEPDLIKLKNHPEINEKMIQERIAENPAILGLGDLELRDKERVQPRAGRLDLLLSDPENDRRFEVEVQLGKSDESHIIRTIEYWDIERKRFPQYEHVAVIIAEDITSRFLNVIGLFNGFIPIIAIQMNAYQFEDRIALIFTKILDEMPLGMEEDDAEEVRQTMTNRDYWLTKKGSEATMAIADRILVLINEISPGHTFKYTRSSIRLEKDNLLVPQVIIKPRKYNHAVLILKSPKLPEIDAILESSDIDDMGYNTRGKNYRLRINSMADSDSAIKEILGQFIKEK